MVQLGGLESFILTTPPPFYEMRDSPEVLAQPAHSINVLISFWYPYIKMDSGLNDLVILQLACPGN